ncbi:MAG: fructose-bisphosphate aldolase, class, partial [Actinomycetota bacterium]|nr:fructose-bisphosphate aldolase, class [Actinomycetota bacterium]
MADLGATAKALVASAKGILAADESFPTIEKRFKSIDIPSTEENRRAYRDMLFNTPGIEEYISGVILFDETLRQSSSDGTEFSKLLESKGVIPGIKVDAGAKDLAYFPGEKVTEGLDGLRGRCEEYYGLGARFTKWRAVITIGDGIPTDFCLHANAHALARYAALSQEAGLVPIVEPETLMDGAHSIDDCYSATKRTLTELFGQLEAHRVELQGTLLKTNMVVSGKDASDQATHREVAERTIQVLKETVPAEIPGVVFLSGGMSDEDSTIRLNEMNKIGGFPWQLSFSYGR